MASLILMSILATAIAMVPVTIILVQDARRTKLVVATPSWTDDDSWRTAELAAPDCALAGSR